MNQLEQLRVKRAEAEQKRVLQESLEEPKAEEPEVQEEAEEITVPAPILLTKDQLDCLDHHVQKEFMRRLYI